MPAIAQTAPAGKTAAAKTAAAKPVAADVAPMLRHHAVLVSASYEDALQAALALQQSITALLAAPSQEGLDAARKAWLAAREFYGQTEAFRFYGGPIDDDNGPEGRMNAWPMDES